MEQSADDVIALMADVLEERSATATSLPELITISSLASRFMQRLTPSSGQGSVPMEQPSTSPKSPASSAETSPWDPESDRSYIGQALTELSELLEKKNSDYRIDGEFSTFEYAAELSGSDVLGVMMTQIGIKLGRLKGLPEDVYNEPKLDTYRDLAGYAIILYAYMVKENS